MEIPNHIVNAIIRYDPLLRLRYSRELNCCILERKTDKRFIAKPVKYRKKGNLIVEETLPEYSERRIQFHDGYIPILKLKKVDYRLLKILYHSDSFKVGKNLPKEVDYKEKKAEEKEEVKAGETIRDCSGEVYDSLLVKQGERIFMNG